MTASEARPKARTTTGGEKVQPPSQGFGEPRRSSSEGETSAGGAPRPVDGEPAVRLDHVSKRFGALKVLEEVTLDIPQGKAFCLLGRSGTGKSVLLRHIIGLVQPDGGKVFVECRDITALKGRELGDVRKHMGFLFQNAALFDSMTVGDNVAFPMRRHTDWADDKIREQAQQKLAAVGLEKDFDKMPGDLSGGMKKRAGLARAMALDPSILLVDEPSAGLDPITAAEIDELLVETKRSGTTLVVVTHNIPSARIVGDDFGVLHEGRLLARGTLEELDASDEPIVQAFMRSQGGG
jgi:phospholipid/cholesterol/gamma-HCH transport system ATP-binding protein